MLPHRSTVNVQQRPLQFGGLPKSCLTALHLCYEVIVQKTFRESIGATHITTIEFFQRFNLRANGWHCSAGKSPRDLPESSLPCGRKTNITRARSTLITQFIDVGVRANRHVTMLRNDMALHGKSRQRRATQG